jgi:hypothetical protein
VKVQIHVASENNFETMSEFIDVLLKPEIEIWHTCEALNPIEVFIASAFSMKDGPTAVAATAWKGSLEDILKTNFPYDTKNPHWDLWLCVIRPEAPEPTPEHEAPVEAPKNKKPLKPEPTMKKAKTVPVKSEPVDSTIISDLLSRKRSFSDLNREFDREIEEATRRLKELQEDVTISGSAPQAGEDVGERSVDPGEGVEGALEAPTGRVLRPKRSKIH